MEAIKMNVYESNVLGKFHIYDKGAVVKNPLSGIEVSLSAEALSVYDIIMGAQICGTERIFHASRDVFLKNWPDEYMTLID